MLRIIKLEKDITWTEFKFRYEKKVLISNEKKRLEYLSDEFFRLTGRKPEDGKVKRTEQATGGTNTKGNGGQSYFFGKGSRKGGGQSEHGSAISREGLEG